MWTFYGQTERNWQAEFDNFTCLEGESLFNLITRFQHLISEMHAYSMPLTELGLVECFANALPDSWSEYIQILRETHVLDTIKFNAFITRLREKEQDDKYRSQRRGHVQDSSLYYADSVPAAPVHAPLQTAFSCKSPDIKSHPATTSHAYPPVQSQNRVMYNPMAGHTPQVPQDRPSPEPAATTNLNTASYNKSSIDWSNQVRDHSSEAETKVSRKVDLKAESDGDDSTTSEESSVSTSDSSDSQVHFAMTANIDESPQVSSETSCICAKCLKLEDRLIQLTRINDDLTLELRNNKVIKGNEKLLSEKNQLLAKQVRELEIALLNKQDAITAYLNDIDKLKREKASIQVDFEKENQKLNRYSKSSYLLEYMLKEQRPNQEKSGIGYNTCPPSILNTLIQSPKEEGETDEIVEQPIPVLEKMGQIKLPQNVKSKELVHGNPRDWTTDSDDALGSSGLGYTDQNPVKPKKPITFKKPEFKGQIVVKAGETSGRGGTSSNEGKYTPPHKRNPSPPTHRPPHVNQNRGLEHKKASSSSSSSSKSRPNQRKMMQSFHKVSEWKTCFDCGEKGHVNYNCPNYSQRPRRRVDRNKTFNENKFSKNRSHSPLKNRELFPDAKRKQQLSVQQVKSKPTPSHTIIDQSTTYFKQPLSKTQTWKTKVENDSDGGSEVPDWSKGQWVHLQALGPDGKPELVTAWVYTEIV